jgi:predicted lipid carrier protein YhbT
MNDSHAMPATPELPSLARKPLGLVPPPLVTAAVAGVLNAIFASVLRQGELGFLAGRVVNVRVTDAELGFSVTFDCDRLHATEEREDADLTIEGTIYTFLLLATRSEDADTLFFHRRLRMSGDTELGLYVKNFLDGLEPESLPFHGAIDLILHWSIDFADKIDAISSHRFSNATRM